MAKQMSFQWTGSNIDVTAKKLQILKHIIYTHSASSNKQKNLNLSIYLILNYDVK